MDSFHVIGRSIQRKEGRSKVTGRARYTNDYEIEGLLYGRTVISTVAHGRIKSIDISKAVEAPGVRAIITGKDYPILTGSTIMDKPPLAIDKVRYFGEPIAIVVADSEKEANRAAELIKVDYEILPSVNSPSQAMESSVLVHERLGEYKILGDIYPRPGTNIANHTKIRKGDIRKGFNESEVIVQGKVSFPQSDHAAMETRSSIAEILPDERVIIHSSTQSPFPIRELISIYFNIDPGKITVIAPLVGGAYGGKTQVHLEVLAYIASKSVGGRPVKINNTREEDMVSSPVHIGLDGKIRLGATKDGILKAAEITYLFDGGAHADRAVIISRAAAVDCTGPYNIDNVWCDSFCMYTNHPFATAFRGFGHSELTFAMERTMDILASRLNMDPLELRIKNAIVPGNTAPTQTPLDRSNLGDLPMCIQRLSELMVSGEDEENISDKNLVRSWGVGCFWKNSNTPTNAGAGAVLTFNEDGSININTGAVEIGQGTKTVLAQILAEKMKMNIDDIHVFFEVNTRVSPEHWKTAASRSIFLVGRAVLDAADDVINQLKDIASRVFKFPKEDFDVGYGRVTLRDNPKIYLNIRDVIFGYTYKNGRTVGEQIIGRGSYAMEDLTGLDPETGRGNPGPEWNVGASAVLVELNKRDYTYRILRAITVVDAGKVLNKKSAIGQITGGMNMGLSFASRESFIFTEDGKIRNAQLRTYKVMHFGENPDYSADFIETPNKEGPYGSRGIGEYGVIGMPAALASSLSRASGVHLNELPLTPELIWKAGRKKNDSL